MKKYSFHIPEQDHNWHVKNKSDMAFVDIRQARSAEFVGHLQKLFETRQIVDLSGSAVSIISASDDLTELCLLNFDKLPAESKAGLLGRMLLNIPLSQLEVLFHAADLHSFTEILNADGITDRGINILWKNKWIIENKLAAATVDVSLHDYHEARAKLTEEEIRSQFADPMGRHGLVSLGQLPVDLMEEILVNGVPSEKQILARNPSLTVKIFKALSKDRSAMVRGSLAENPSLPAILFECLAHDPMAGVRAAIASRKDTPLKILKELAHDMKSQVVALAAERTIAGLG